MKFARLIATLLSACALTCAAADFPSGTVKLVHGFPGGLVDVGTRILADELAAAWKQPVIVEAKPGANEMIAADSVARSAKDGQTLLVGSEAVFVNNGLLYRKAMIDAEKSLVPVNQLFDIQFALVVRADLGVNTLAEFVALMKKEGGRREYASSGPGSPLQLAMEGFAHSAGFSMLHVPYKTIAQVTQDLIGGLIDATFLSVPSAMPFVKSGKMKILAVTGNARSVASPQTPTFREAGYPDVNYGTTIVLAAPAGTPPSVVAKIQADVRRILQSPQFATRFLVPQEVRAGDHDGASLVNLLGARRVATQRLIRKLDLKLD